MFDRIGCCLSLEQTKIIFQENIEWNPNGEQFAVYFNRQTSNRGEELQGLYLADVNRRGKENLIRLYENLDVNTLWFSAKGTYVLWSTYPMSGRISGMDSAISSLDAAFVKERVVPTIASGCSRVTPSRWL